MIVKITPETLKDIEVEFTAPSSIKITGFFILKEENAITNFNKELGFYCSTKKEKIKKIPINIEKDLQINPVYLHSIESKKLKKIILKYLNTELKNYNVSSKVFEKIYPGTGEENLIKRDYRSNYDTNSKEKIYEITDYIIAFDSYYFEQAIVGEFRNILKKANVKFYNFLNIYNDSIFIDIKKIKELKQKIPYLIGGWESVYPYDLQNSVAYKYFLESPELILTTHPRKIKFQRYYKSKDFHLLGITYSEKHLCKLTKEEFVEFKNIQDTEAKLTFLSALYDDAENIIQETFRDDLTKIEQIVNKARESIKKLYHP